MLDPPGTTPAADEGTNASAPDIPGSSQPGPEPTQAGTDADAGTGAGEAAGDGEDEDAGGDEDAGEDEGACPGGP
jgi:hypothetical protein